uniref:Uncharacterized protein n=1 Tax=Elaeophora elaphi TaxID=1147741 RepID=A0A0R3RTG5_9BILA
MDTTATGSSIQSKQDNRSQLKHPIGELYEKRKKLLKEIAVFAEEEENMWEHSKPIIAQNIDDDENVKQSHRVCKEIAKQFSF